MNKFMEQFLAKRGYSSDYLKKIECGFYPPLLNSEALCARLHRLKENQDCIVVLPDFDMDGIMSGVVGLAGLCQLGFNVQLYTPDPKKGYGFNDQTIDEIVEWYPDVKAILTCDVGITCFEGIEHAKELGLEVLVTDHHLEGNRKPAADCIVDPCQKEDSYPHLICGAFVLWQILNTYAHTYGTLSDQKKIQLLRIFAGFGTISDMMPMLYENRCLVKEALRMAQLLYSNGNPWYLNTITGHPVFTNAFRGMFFLLNELAANKTFEKMTDIEEETVAFTIAPMFNSMKRLGLPSDHAFDVFFRQTCEEQVQAVRFLIEANEKRKQLISEKLEAIKGADNPFAPYIYLADCESGVCGLLAAKMVEETKLPCFVIHEGTDGTWRGSARVPKDMPVFETLQTNGFTPAGHEAAFGISMKDFSEVQRLYSVMQNGQFAQFQKPEESDVTIPAGELDLHGLKEFFADLLKMKPFGPEFKKPKIRMAIWPEFVQLICFKEKKHLKARFGNVFDMIFWNQGYLEEEARKARYFSALGELKKNQQDSLYFQGTLEIPERETEMEFDYDGFDDESEFENQLGDGRLGFADDPQRNLDRLKMDFEIGY